VLQAVLALILGYLLGAIPTGAVVAKVYGRVDLTQVGSRRTGATNVLRTLGPGAAAIVFLGDFLKGALAVLAARLLWPGDSWPEALAGMAAVLGHVYSPFLGFKGGRGVTTALGGLLVLSPLAGGLAALAGLAIIVATRYVSLGSILGTTVGGIAAVVGALRFGLPAAYAAFGIAVGLFIVVAHRDNIDRLLHGTERRLGERVEQSG
jgi:glycerol-3-phosphate acyltransferase PlsY